MLKLTLIACLLQTALGGGNTRSRGGVKKPRSYKFSFATCEMGSGDQYSYVCSIPHDEKVLTCDNFFPEQGVVTASRGTPPPDPVGCNDVGLVMGFQTEFERTSKSSYHVGGRSKKGEVCQHESGVPCWLASGKQPSNATTSCQNLGEGWDGLPKSAAAYKCSAFINAKTMLAA